MTGNSNSAFVEENELHPITVIEYVNINLIDPSTIQLQSNEYPNYQKKNEEEMLAKRQGLAKRVAETLARTQVRTLGGNFKPVDYSIAEKRKANVDAETEYHPESYQDARERSPEARVPKQENFPEARVPRRLYSPEVRAPGREYSPEIRVQERKYFPEIRLSGQEYSPKIRVQGWEYFPEIRVPGREYSPEVRAPRWEYSPEVRAPGWEYSSEVRASGREYSSEVRAFGREYSPEVKAPRQGYSEYRSSGRGEKKYSGLENAPIHADRYPVQERKPSKRMPESDPLPRQPVDQSMHSSRHENQEHPNQSGSAYYDNKEITDSQPPKSSYQEKPSYQEKLSQKDELSYQEKLSQKDKPKTLLKPRGYVVEQADPPPMADLVKYTTASATFSRRSPKFKNRSTNVASSGDHTTGRT